jgi:tetratricopeptide (TPR) repeat protein
MGPSALARRLTAFLVALILLPFAPAGARQTPSLSETPPSKEDLDAELWALQQDLRKGRWNATIPKLEKHVAAHPDHVPARVELVRSLRAVGRYDDADREMDAALQRTPDDRDALHVALEQHLTRGRFGELERAAERLLRQNSKDLRALRHRGLALLEQGKREEAETAFRAVANIAREDLVEDAASLCDVAVAFSHLGGDQEVVDALDDAKKADPDYVETYLLLGAFLLGKYEDVQAIKEYRLLLEKNPGVAEAHAGLVECYLYRGEDAQALAECANALAVNPNLLPALEAKALGALEDLKFAEARSAVDRALAVNPNSRRTRAALAAHHYLLNDRAAFGAECARVLAIDPEWGELYYVVGEALANRMRFEEALSMCRKAVEVDPTLWKAWVSVGKYSFHTGDEAAGVEALKKAQEGDPWLYPWRENMLTLAEYLKEFVTIKTPHFHVRLHVEEKAVLAEYLPALLEEAWDDMTRRYGFEPQAPILVEVFPEQKDFAVRTIGMEGIPGILGACFGGVITLDSPQAFRDRKSKKPFTPPFSWARTTWHEFAHVMALQMSNSRVPRWFTEGLSTWEERKSRFDWDREMDYDLFLAEQNGRIIPLAELNAAFRTNRIIFAYYQGGLICEFIETTFGWEKILQMLRLFGQDKQTPEVVREVLGLGAEDFDRRFLEFVRGKTASVRAFPVYDPDVVARMRREAESRPEDAELLLRIAWGYFWLKKPTDCGEYLDRALRLSPDHPSAWALRGYIAFNEGSLDKAEEHLKKAAEKGVRDFILYQRLGQIAKRAKRTDEAIAHFEASQADFPRYVGEGNSYVELEALYRSKDRHEEASRQLEAYARIAHNDVRVRRRLADAYGEREDWVTRLRYLEEIHWVNPFDVDLHRDLAAAYRKLGRLDAASRELRAAIALTDAEGSADLHAELAEVYAERGMMEEARQEAQEALRARPDHEKAVKFLERWP